jgi:hypothetical protein
MIHAGKAIAVPLPNSLDLNCLIRQLDFPAFFPAANQIVLRGI